MKDEETTTLIPPTFSRVVVQFHPSPCDVQLTLIPPTFSRVVIQFLPSETEDEVEGPHGMKPVVSGTMTGAGLLG
jgi:hypothetical protein